MTMCNCNNSLALYVWEGDGVLEAWKTGRVCVLACCEDEAWRLIAEQDQFAFDSLSGELDQPRGFSPRKEPRRVDEPEAFISYGGE